MVLRAGKGPSEIFLKSPELQLSRWLILMGGREGFGPSTRAFHLRPIGGRMATQLHPEAQTFEPDSLDVNQLLKTMMALKRGDFSVRLPMEWTGKAGKIADTFNYVVEMNERMASELER